VSRNKIYLKNYIGTKHLRNKNYKKLNSKFQKIFKSIDDEVKNKHKTLNVLSKKYKFSFKTSQLNKFKKYNKIALIGMGGSILGAEAIYYFFKEKIKKKFYFFNDLNEKELLNLKKNENLNKILFIIISKSGNTIETLSNIFSLNILRAKAKNVIIISENKNNLLCNLARKLNLFFVEHNKHIGGRYSVLSEVGLIPALFMGISLPKIRKKLSSFLGGKNKKKLKENSIKMASIMNSKKFNNLILLNYSPELEKFLFWCQQLIAESLGKKNIGFLPIISNAPKDHHSLLQLYLDGPKDKLFCIFSLDDETKTYIKAPKILNKKIFLHQKSIGKIKMSQKKALIKTFIKNDIPFREFKINKKDEETIGELFAYFILETIIIGKLSNVNPYDQPAVEQVKVLTKKILS